MKITLIGGVGANEIFLAHVRTNSPLALSSLSIGLIVSTQFIKKYLTLVVSNILHIKRNSKGIMP